MFAVAFEVLPHPETRQSYLDTAKTLRPILEAIDGFLDIDRYASTTRPGWMLSLSFWRDEAALVRWRAQERHHLAQVDGRARIFADYRIRVCQIVFDEEIDQPPRTPARRTAYRDPGREPPRFLSFVEGVGAGRAAAARGEMFDSIYHPGKTLLVGEHATEANTPSLGDALRGLERAPATPPRLRLGEVERDYRLRVRDDAPQFME